MYAMVHLWVLTCLSIKHSPAGYSCAVNSTLPPELEGRPPVSAVKAELIFPYSALEIRNVHAEERFGEDANNFYGNPNAVTFFHVNVETATRNNHFPTEGYAGTLMAINLYGSHLIQVFFCMDGYIYIRTLSDYQNPSGSNFTQWRKI